MPHMREVKTCDRCRHFKRRCDLLKPSCSRCVQAGVRCSFENPGSGGVSSASAPNGSSVSPVLKYEDNPDGKNGLISPSDSVEETSEQKLLINSLSGAVDASSLADDSTTVAGPSSGGGAHAGQRVVRKRKRNCLSCLRCHRLKVKCDKELPCGRCKSSGNGRECYYSYNKGPNGGKFPCPTVPNPSSGSEITKSTQATWHVSHEPRGSSHWRDLMTKIAHLTTKESPTLTTALENVATNACLANFTLPGNFPFGTPGATKYYARDAVVKLVESERPRCQTYIDRYINLLDCVNPILDVAVFQRELEAYWQDTNSVSLCWLAQLLMVMGLGAFATPSHEEPSIATELMMGAEACLMQTPFMFRPTFASLKATCLMVVAKQVCNPTCWFVDSCWSLLGLLVRMCFIFGLPQDSSEGMDAAERSSRRRLWLTILYLDIKLSLPTGMPPLTRPDELSSLKSMPELGEHSGLQQILSESLPVVLSILVQLNSGNDQIPYPEVLRYNAQIRALMAHAQRVCTNELQRTTVDIYLRRCLMVLHRPFALHLDGPTMFPESYWSSLECSLAVLMHYRNFWYEDPAHRYDLVGRAFTHEFFSAALQASVHVLRPDAPLAGAAGTGCEIVPRQIILDTLKSCVEIWQGEQHKSVCWRTSYNVLHAIMGLMPDSDMEELETTPTS
ncbi:N-terminal binuclear Zn cluster-containing protein [Emericellopsis atlantica]|uniref:N-terminal binuclear Zn cluster-containing protein n=1 Tax=Emericellopsis atlantica TaxID=2614577 RepID=A0A9P8CMI2_9HYPO|nr:N-terminal binuclear Zn cluster-containing protein [Emericellopsis atlantica]KAG9250711.1 N-terminal binuclear Zn cluster-containing protein [Emericellopsis atlantica]